MIQKIIWWVLIISWCSFIYVQSDKPADESSKSSIRIVELVNKSIEGVAGHGRFAISETFVRKVAHFLEYFVLGCLLFMGFLRTENFRKTIIFALAAGFLYAVSDELHQNYVPGRAMRYYDVIIDTAGVATGLYVLYRFYRKKKIKAGYTG